LCALLNSHLAALARVYPATKFLRAQASEVDFMSSDLDADTLPTVLVYRRGELETTWIRFDLELEGAVLRDGERGRKQRLASSISDLGRTRLRPEASRAHDPDTPFTRSQRRRHHRLASPSFALCILRLSTRQWANRRGRRRRRRRVSETCLALEPLLDALSSRTLL